MCMCVYVRACVCSLKERCLPTLLHPLAERASVSTIMLAALRDWAATEHAATVRQTWAEA